MPSKSRLVANRVFVDTNVVWNWHTYGDIIADNMDFNDQEVSAKIGKKGLEDMYGMQWLYQVATNDGTIQFVVNPNVLQELQRKVRDKVGWSRLQWGAELFGWWEEQQVDGVENFSFSNRRAQTWLDQGVLDFLPDSEDRILIAAAYAAHCGIFLTMDYKTILPFRDRINKLTKIRVLRPSEYAKEVY